MISNYKEFSSLWLTISLDFLGFDMIFYYFLLSWNFLPSDIYESGDKLALGVLAVVCVSTFVKIQS